MRGTVQDNHPRSRRNDAGRESAILPALSQGIRNFRGDLSDAPRLFIEMEFGGRAALFEFLTFHDGRDTRD